VRSTVLERLGEPFVQSARARGLSQRRVLWTHALRAGLGPIAQLAGLSLAALLSGTIAVEVVFGWPGLGRATYDALVARDYPLLLAGTALSAAFVLAGSFLAEALQARLDPRLRDV
jgi:peptide/nickel transport system permease protein